MRRARPYRTLGHNERRAWDKAHFAWEFPDDVPADEVDRGVTAVFYALNNAPVQVAGLPGEVLSLRAIVGIVLASRKGSKTSWPEVAGEVMAPFYEADAKSPSDE